MAGTETLGGGWIESHRRIAGAALFLVALLAGLAALAGGWMIWGQESFIFFPDRAMAGTPALAGLRFEEVALRTADGPVLAGWWVPAERPRGAVIFCHGNAGNISHRLDRLSQFRDLGLSVLAFDYRGYGASQGRPTEEGTYRDMDSAVEHVERARGLSPHRTLFWGESLGGAVAVEAATRHPCAGVVLESTFTSVPEMARLYYAWLPARLLTIRYDTLGRLPSLAVPLLVLHSPEDDIVPFAMGERLYAAARPPKALVRLRGGHNDGGLPACPEATDLVRRWLEDVLPVPPADPRGPTL
jgi:fermentation-respiration switch protein FrsA (DUF1100 family)